jgi:hypothetical protein
MVSQSNFSHSYSSSSSTTTTTIAPTAIAITSPHASILVQDTVFGQFLWDKICEHQDQGLFNSCL